MNYKDFLEKKKVKFKESGFTPVNLNKYAKPFQKYTCTMALKNGRYAVFADTGLGKTLMLLMISNQITKRECKPVLILSPLAVSRQTINEGRKFGVDIEYLKSDVFGEGIYITNYEQLKNVKTEQFVCVCLDESSILKNETGKYRNYLIKKFENFKYKFCFSATPSPNDPMELGNHAEFLGVMKYQEMLSMYFVHDAGATQKWRLKGHAVDKFYEFISTWAIMYSHPKDIGFNDDEYDLPKLHIIEKQVKTPTPEGQLFGGVAVNATEYNKSLRETEQDRIWQSIELVKSIGRIEPIIIWAKQNQEAANIYKHLNLLGYACRNVQGSDSNEKKERDLIGFSKGDFQILITKQSIASQGLNYQHCAYQIFNSVDFSFEQSYQAMRRSWRFGQKREVICYMITTDRMINVIKAQQDKHLSFRTMQERMTNAILKNIDKKLGDVKVKSSEVKTDKYHLLNGDCVQESKKLKDNSAGLVVFSPPFAELYTYSDNIEDMGNSKNYNEFAEHFKYLIPEISRVLMPGRICAIHCMDLPIQKGKEGYIGLRDFSGMLIDWFTKNGFIYHARVTIWKNPVIEMQRTKALGLLHKQIKKDSVMSRVGIPDYVLFFRNTGENETPIQNKDIPVDLWQKYASPTWNDVDYSRTLNYREGRQSEDEKHICPLQLDTIERIITLYSNKGEVVFSPFGGIGSEGYQALKMDRKSISIELKNSYFDLNVKNHEMAKCENSQLELL